MFLFNAILAVPQIARKTAVAMLLAGLTVQPWAQATSATLNPKTYKQEGLADLPALKASVACENLRSADLSAAVGAKTEVLSATVGTHDGVAYCKVRTLIAPNINSEFRLPVHGWTQRYLQTGCGGLCGVLDIHLDHAKGCVPADTHGLALGSTDMGHASRNVGEGEFGNDPQARIDFAYRGVHLTAMLGKQLVQQYYAAPARYNYFSGCSDGGREALAEAQRYPDDFNGIAAGAPAMNFQIQNSFYHGWQATSNTDANGKTVLTADKLPILHEAVLAACDALDGQKDGLINDPRQCKFDPARIQCPEGRTDTSQCLTLAQVTTVRKLYAGPQDVQGRHLTIGGPQYGSELSWEGVFVTKSADQPVPSTFMALGSIKNLIFEQNLAADYSLKDFHFDAGQFDQVRAMHALYDTTNPDLTRFAAAGGKLILWHGWSDPHISPINTIAYYTAVTQLMGTDRTAAFAKLFLFPGMYHCGMGDGPSEFDLLTPLMRWTESNHAPTSLVAHTMSAPPFKMDGHPPAGMPPMPDLMKNKVADKTRIIFAYPDHAVYKGSGNPVDPASYTKQVSSEPTSYEWYGAEFMKPGLQKQCSATEGKLVCK